MICEGQMVKKQRQKQKKSVKTKLHKKKHYNLICEWQKLQTAIHNLFKPTVRYIENMKWLQKPEASGLEEKQELTYDESQ